MAFPCINVLYDVFNSAGVAALQLSQHLAHYLRLQYSQVFFHILWIYTN